MTYFDLHTHTLQPSTDKKLSICNLPYEMFFVAPDAYPDTYFSAGIHPWDISSAETATRIGQLAQIASSPRLLAIGECGLDKLSGSPMNIQEEIFKQQIEISEYNKKPMIIHCVKAFNELIRLREESNARQTWIVHGFRGKPQLATSLMQHGIKLSIGLKFNPAITDAIQPSQLLLETDDSRCDIETIYRQAAKTWHIAEEHLITLVRKTFSGLFGLPEPEKASGKLDSVTP